MSRRAASALSLLFAACTSDPDLIARAEDGAKSPECVGMLLDSGSYSAPDDLCVTAAATQQGSLRGIDFAPNGDLYGVLEHGTIRRFRDLDGDGVFDEIKDLGTAFGRGGSLDVDE